MSAYFDKIIIGGGIYGLYAADVSSQKGERVCVLEYDDEPFCRATYINQARVHNGYHYPRSYSTAVKSAHYFERFCQDFDFAINGSFSKIYATAAHYSWTNAQQFRDFCRRAGIPCESVPTERYFREGMCDGAFLTREYTFDAQLIKEHYLRQLRNRSGVSLLFGARLQQVSRSQSLWKLREQHAGELTTPYILNATYASTNQVSRLFGFSGFPIKYEIAEIILVKVSDALCDVGLTVMDGPFFSVMPFGKTGLHSLTSVTFTPHMTAYGELPDFPCQRQNLRCTQEQLENCNTCGHRPESAYPYMSAMARKYLREEYHMEYVRSLFAIKPILKVSEIDDSRPTVIREDSREPYFASVLSGKINTIYDLDAIL